MNEQTLYYSFEDKHYRLKVAGDSVSIERQRNDFRSALPQETFPFDVFPVMDDRYWIEGEVNRLIAWYEAEMDDFAAPLTGQDISAEQEEWDAAQGFPEEGHTPSMIEVMRHRLEQIDLTDPRRLQCMPSPLPRGHKDNA